MKRTRIEPGPDQESVWDYPRPPRIEDCSQRIRVIAGGQTIADSRNAKRVLETSHPPVYYIPPQDIDQTCLIRTRGRSYCEWKGEAGYYSVQVAGRIIEKAAWFYFCPTRGFSDIEGYVAFYPSKMDACYVDEQRVRAQEGDFYGGWITPNVVGPF